MADVTSIVTKGTTGQASSGTNITGAMQAQVNAIANVNDFAKPSSTGFAHGATGGGTTSVELQKPSIVGTPKAPVPVAVPSPFKLADNRWMKPAPPSPQPKGVVSGQQTGGILGAFQEQAKSASVILNPQTPQQPQPKGVVSSPGYGTPPAGTPAGYVPSHDVMGNIVWKPPMDVSVSGGKTVIVQKGVPTPPITSTSTVGSSQALIDANKARIEEAKKAIPEKYLAYGTTSVAPGTFSDPTLGGQSFFIIDTRTGAGSLSIMTPGGMETIKASQVKTPESSITQTGIPGYGIDKGGNIVSIRSDIYGQAGKPVPKEPIIIPSLVPAPTRTIVGGTTGTTEGGTTGTTEGLTTLTQASQTLPILGMPSYVSTLLQPVPQITGIPVTPQSTVSQSASPLFQIAASGLISPSGQASMLTSTERTGDLAYWEKKRIPETVIQATPIQSKVFDIFGNATLEESRTGAALMKPSYEYQYMLSEGKSSPFQKAFAFVPAITGAAVLGGVEQFKGAGKWTVETLGKTLSAVTSPSIKTLSAAGTQYAGGALSLFTAPFDIAESGTKAVISGQPGEIGKVAGSVGASALLFKGVSKLSPIGLGFGKADFVLKGEEAMETKAIRGAIEGGETGIEGAIKGAKEAVKTEPKYTGAYIKIGYGENPVVRPIVGVSSKGIELLTPSVEFTQKELNAISDIQFGAIKGQEGLTPLETSIYMKNLGQIVDTERGAVIKGGYNVQRYVIGRDAPPVMKLNELLAQTRYTKLSAPELYNYFLGQKQQLVIRGSGIHKLLMGEEARSGADLDILSSDPAKTSKEIYDVMKLKYGDKVRIGKGGVGVEVIDEAGAHHAFDIKDLTKDNYLEGYGSAGKPGSYLGLGFIEPAPVEFMANIQRAKFGGQLVRKGRTIITPSFKEWFKGKVFKSKEHVKELIPGHPKEPESILSGSKEKLEMHHIAKKGENKQGVILTREEHKLIHYLQDIGKDRVPPEYKDFFNLLKEREEVPTKLAKDIETYRNSGAIEKASGIKTATPFRVEVIDKDRLKDIADFTRGSRFLINAELSKAKSILPWERVSAERALRGIEAIEKYYGIKPGMAEQAPVTIELGFKPEAPAKTGYGITPATSMAGFKAPAGIPVVPADKEGIGMSNLYWKKPSDVVKVSEPSRIERTIISRYEAPSKYSLGGGFQRITTDIIKPSVSPIKSVEGSSISLRSLYSPVVSSIGFSSIKPSKSPVPGKYGSVSGLPSTADYGRPGASIYGYPGSAKPSLSGYGLPSKPPSPKPSEPPSSVPSPPPSPPPYPPPSKYADVLKQQHLEQQWKTNMFEGKRYIIRKHGKSTPPKERYIGIFSESVSKELFGRATVPSGEEPVAVAPTLELEMSGETFGSFFGKGGFMRSLGGGEERGKPKKKGISSGLSGFGLFM